jgi:hypothetical protein
MGSMMIRISQMAGLAIGPWAVFVGRNKKFLSFSQWKAAAFPPQPRPGGLSFPI